MNYYLCTNFGEILEINFLKKIFKKNIYTLKFEKKFSKKIYIL